MLFKGNVTLRGSWITTPKISGEENLNIGQISIKGMKF